MKTCGNCANRNRNECCTAVPMCVAPYIEGGGQGIPTDDDDDASDCACWAPKERPADR